MEAGALQGLRAGGGGASAAPPRPPSQGVRATPGYPLYDKSAAGSSGKTRVVVLGSGERVCVLGGGGRRAWLAGTATLLLAHTPSPLCARTAAAAAANARLGGHVVPARLGHIAARSLRAHPGLSQKLCEGVPRPPRLHARPTARGGGGARGLVHCVCGQSCRAHPGTPCWRLQFVYTPLLPAMCAGTVEERSIVEPVRAVMGDKVSARGAPARGTARARGALFSARRLRLHAGQVF